MVEKPTKLFSFAPRVHTQQGSPSSSPLVCPSPSVSIRQRAGVHTYPWPLKSNRKGLFVGLFTLWPVSLPLTWPFGTRSWYWENPREGGRRRRGRRGMGSRRRLVSVREGVGEGGGAWLQPCRALSPSPSSLARSLPAARATPRRRAEMPFGAVHFRKENRWVERNLRDEAAGEPSLAWRLRPPCVRG